MRQILTITFLFSGVLWAQDKPISDLEAVVGTSSKPVVVFIHTDWCTYCEKMLQTTFLDDVILSQLEGRLFFLNAEKEGPITIRGQVFSINQTGKNKGIHELAVQLANSDEGVLYPSTVVLNNDFEIIYLKQGFMDGPTFKYLLEQL